MSKTTEERRDMATTFLVAVVKEVFDQTEPDELAEAFGIEFGEALAVLFEMGDAKLAIFWDDELPECDCDDCECEDDDL